MRIVTLEGMVEDGVIRLTGGALLPDRTRVFVVVPDSAAEPPARLNSPRLAHPGDAAEFRMEVVQGPADAAV